MISQSETGNRTRSAKRSGEIDESGKAARSSTPTMYAPRFDIAETSSEFTMFGDLPGVAPDQLEIHVDQRELTIVGKVAPREHSERFLYSEYGIGDFRRSFTLDEIIDGQAIKAELANGVLVLHLPKIPEVKPRRIEVKAG